MTSDPNSSWLTLVMHELRTLLTAATGYLGLAHTMARQVRTTLGATAPSSLDHLERCLTQAAQELDFATAMLADLAVANEEHIAIQPLLCNLSEIVREVVEARSILMPTRVIHVHASAIELPVLADPLRVKQVLTNYLMNALKYTPAERPITVLVEQASPQFVRVVVRDEGPGIPLDAQPHLWEKGYRVPGGSQGREGLGLGLYICRLLIERQGERSVLTAVRGMEQASGFRFRLFPRHPKPLKSLIQARERCGSHIRLPHAYSRGTSLPAGRFHLYSSSRQGKWSIHTQRR